MSNEKIIPMKYKKGQTQGELNDLTGKADELTDMIQQRLPELNISKKEVISMLAGEVMGRSMSEVQREFREKGVPSRRSLWAMVKAIANRIAQLPSTFAKVMTVLPTVALIFQTFFLGTKTEKLQHQSLDLLQSGQSMQGELSSLSEQTFAFKEGLEEQLMALSAQVEPPTIEGERTERDRRKKMQASVRKRIGEQLADPSNTSRKLSDELKASIVNFTKYCKPYQLLYVNLSPERGYLLSLLDRENIDSSDYREICEKGDFQYADCSKKKFAHVDFSNLDLQFASFENGAIASSNLRGTNLCNANLKGCSFWNSDLQNAEINAANLEGAKFRNARLKNLKLNDTDISSIEFNENTDFTDVQLNGAYSFDFSGIKGFMSLTELDSLYAFKSEPAESAKYFELLRIYSR